MNITPTRSMVRAGQRGGRPLTQYGRHVQVKSRASKISYVFDAVYPGSRNDQICFSDFTDGFALNQLSDDHARMSEEEIEKDLQAYAKDHPDLNRVRIHYTDGQLKKFVRARTIGRAIDRHPELRELNPSIRDGMIFRKIYSVNEFVEKVRSHPVVVKWRLDNPNAFRFVNNAQIAKFVRNPNPLYYRKSFDDRYANMYHPAAIAIAAFLGVRPKDIFGALPDIEGFEFSRARLEYFKRAGAVDVAGPLPESDIAPPMIDELVSDHYHDLRNTFCPYDEEGNPLDRIPSQPPRFPVHIDEKARAVILASDQEESDPSWRATYHSLVDVTREVLFTLTPREEWVIRARFGINLPEAITLEKLGEMQGVTRERIRQIESKALRKLKHPARSKKLAPFYTPLSSYVPRPHAQMASKADASGNGGPR